MKDAYEAYHYHQRNIYNMDESGMTLSNSRGERRVGPVRTGRKAQLYLADNVHIIELYYSVCSKVVPGEQPLIRIRVYSRLFDMCDM